MPKTLQESEARRMLKHIFEVAVLAFLCHFYFSWQTLNGSHMFMCGCFSCMETLLSSSRQVKNPSRKFLGVFLHICWFIEQSSEIHVASFPRVLMILQIWEPVNNVTLCWLQSIKPSSMGGF